MKNTTWRDIATVIPYDINAKLHPPEQVEKIAMSIREYGWDQPIVVDAAGVIIKGHGRLAASKLLGLDKVPVLVRDDLTPAQVKAARIADNKVAESEWDKSLLSQELNNLYEADYNMDLLGFTGDELKGLMLSGDDDEEDNEPETSAPEFDLLVSLKDEDSQQELFLELRDRGFKVKA